MLKTPNPNIVLQIVKNVYFTLNTNVMLLFTWY